MKFSYTEHKDANGPYTQFFSRYDPQALLKKADIIALVEEVRLTCGKERVYGSKGTWSVAVWNTQQDGFRVSGKRIVPTHQTISFLQVVLAFHDPEEALQFKLTHDCTAA
jgi:hypothetical protein